jgi:hypothetical protein
LGEHGSDLAEAASRAVKACELLAIPMWCAPRFLHCARPARFCEGC